MESPIKWTYLLEETQPKPMLHCRQYALVRISLFTVKQCTVLFSVEVMCVCKNSIINPSATHWFQLRSDSSMWIHWMNEMKWNDIDALQPLLFGSKLMEKVVQVKRGKKATIIYYYYHYFVFKNLKSMWTINFNCIIIWFNIINV